MTRDEHLEMCRSYGIADDDAAELWRITGDIFCAIEAGGFDGAMRAIEEAMEREVNRRRNPSLAEVVSLPARDSVVWRFTAGPRCDDEA